MRFHTPSLAVGAAVAALVVLLSAQQLVSGPTLHVRVIEPATVHLPAHPKSFVRIVDGQPFAVPSDRLLVLRSFGHSDEGQSSQSIQLLIDNVIVWRKTSSTLLGSSPPFDPGIVAGPNSTVEVRTPNGWDPLVLLGYLADN